MGLVLCRVARAVSGVQHVSYKAGWIPRLFIVQNLVLPAGSAHVYPCLEAGPAGFFQIPGYGVPGY